MSIAVGMDRSGRRAADDPRIHTVSMDFGDGGGGMNVKHCGRVLGPASVQGSKKRRWVYAGAYSAQCGMHLRTPGIGVRRGQLEVSDIEHGCQGKTTGMSAHRCVERAT
ncbi:hypothetical protein B0H13DRAFT_1877435 [Mycena leptocephala]|nr:hypothetical protein B0H13DRAFT_1877435 [Mycena leptocephala]